MRNNIETCERWIDLDKCTSASLLAGSGPGTGCVWVGGWGVGLCVSLENFVISTAVSA